MPWANEETNFVDWLNLPQAAGAISLWDSLHDGEVFSIRSNPIERTMALSCKIQHLSNFYNFGENAYIDFYFEGVQSARVLRYSIWPGGCSIPDGLSVEEQRKIVEEYQSKWREESGSWTDFESSITPDKNQTFGIYDAALVAPAGGPVALKLCGAVNWETYHEVFLRAETFKISGPGEKYIQLREFQKLGERYWRARSNQVNPSE
jgi:uncharacterized protein YbdZ (MbtH family)